MVDADKKREYRAWLISAGIHVALFIVVCLTGLFVIVSPAEDRPVDVILYDADAGASGPAGGGDAAPAQAEAAPPPPSFDDVVLDSKVEKLPEITETFTKEPQKQEQFKKEHNAPVAPAVVFSANGNGSGASAGTASGTGFGGNGSGTSGISGTGSGNGAGEGNGGNGDGGSGAGDGTGKGLRPAILPELISAPRPSYPSRLRRRNVEGDVTVTIIVGTDGAVESAEVSSSSGYPSMDKAALQAAYGYRYTPSYNEYGEAVSFTKRIHVAFRITD